jgi:PAS domain S-box-containing protein
VDADARRPHAWRAGYGPAARSAAARSAAALGYGLAAFGMTAGAAAAGLSGPVAVGLSAGVLFGVLLAGPARLAPFLVVAHAAALAAAGGVAGLPEAPGARLAAAVAPTAAYGLVAVALRRAGLNPRVGTVRDVALLAGGMLLAPSAAVLLCLIPVAAEGATAAQPCRLFGPAWAGGIIGIATATPLVLALAAITPRWQWFPVRTRLRARLHRESAGRRRAEQELADREARLVALINAAHDDAVALLAPDGTVLTCNDRCAHGLDTTVEELTGRCIWDFTPPDLAELRRARVAEAVAARRLVRFEEQRRGRWLITSLYPSFADDGRLVAVAVFAHDITEQKAVADTLESTVARLTHAEQIARLGHWQRDAAGGRVEWSPGMFALFGLSPETGQPGFDTFLRMVHPDDRPRVQAAAAAVQAEAAPRHLQYRIVRTDGSLGHIESRVEVTVDDRGVPRTLFGVALDLTDKLAAETALRESEVRYRSLIETTRFGIVEVDRDGVILYANPAMYRLAGGTGNGLKGTNVRDLVEEPGRAGLAVDVTRLGPDPAAAGPYASRLIGPDGAGLEVELDWAPKRDRTGAVTGFVGVFSDVTARRRAEAELHRFRTIIEVSEEAIAVSDVRGRIVYANPAHHRLFGYRPRDGAALANADLYLSESLDVLEREVYPRCCLGESWEGVLEARNADGRRFPVWERRDALRGPDGIPILIIGMMHDYSDEQRRQWEIREARDRAEQANVAKSRFLAAASHDLRQPLQALVMFFDLLGRRNRDPNLSELIDKIGQSLGAFQDMLNTLLDISKLDAGVMAPEVGPVPLGPVLARLDDEFAPIAEAADLILVTVPTGLVARTDQGLLERMLRNLLSNALRYTPRGRVLFGCRRSGTTVRLQVHDTGIGIPEDQQEAIFGEYYQIDNPARDRRQGLGLGLAIVDRLSRLLGHPVRVRSTPGRGTMFEIDLPMVEAPAVAVPRAAPPVAAATGLIAVLDDNPEVLRALQMSLEGFGHRVIAATDTGRLTLTLRQSGCSPDIIMADFRLAGGDTGSDAIRALRADFGADIPGILLTGDTSPERLREATGSGFRLLHKPIRPAELSRLVEAYLLAAQD